MELSVIIVSYNVRYFLEQCLTSVRRASEGISCEIFVVDNNSADGSCSMVSNDFPEVKLIINHENKGFSAACNQGMKIAEGRYVLLLNPDTLVGEDTFKKCIAFMDDHPDAGAAGIKMIDGKGKFLPESKRAIPTPVTAFFKMTGLLHIFPNSGFINRYYLGHLDNDKTSQAEVISGAFMFIRKEAFIKTGFLDEDYFMYGEDIDYSYRLIKSGFKNYYYPETKIIHYKGQSTKKENLNTLVNFYKAMLIFVKKHFNHGNSRSFIFLIQTAIFFRAGLSLFKRIIKVLLLPLTDTLFIYLIFRLVTSLWADLRFENSYNYPGTFTKLLLPLYTIIIVLSVALLSGYRKPSTMINTLKGAFIGIITLLVIYALLPLKIRFSRAIIVIGSLLSAIVITFWRLLLSFIIPEIASNPVKREKMVVIVSDSEGYDRIKELLTSPPGKTIAGRVSIDRDDFKEEVLGNLAQIRDVIRINRIGEIILSSRCINATEIIDLLHQVSDLNISIKIASADEKYILGTRYINSR